MKKEIIRYLGIDWGEKRIGLALGDSEIKVATPYKVVHDIDGIKQIIKDEEIKKLVVGKPLKMRDAESKIQNEFLEFLDLMKKEIDIPVELIDERLSSKAADSLEGDKKTKAPRDAIAAMIILQSYLDKEYS